ncbi:MAG: hypothetical protein ACKKL6_03750 [Candidatus Komeilibacteria bacterium]
MKNFMKFLMIAILTVMVMVSCDNGPTGPTDKPDETMGKLILVPLGNDALSKVYVGEDGNKYLPREAAVDNLRKMGRLAVRLEDVNKQSLAKIASAMIDYGEVLNTRILQYVIMNVGNQDIFDIDFTANDLVIFPGAISLIQASEQGTEVTALPIVNIAKEHVTPISGVGSLLDMTVGGFTDTLTLSYKYTTGNDTVVVEDAYNVAGSTMGAIIDVMLSGTSFSEHSFNETPNTHVTGNDWSSWPIQVMWPFYSEDMDTTVISNNGNAPMRIRVVSLSTSTALIDTILGEYSEVDVSGLLAPNDTDSTGNTVLIGDTRNQPYIFNFGDRLEKDGYLGVMFAN